MTWSTKMAPDGDAESVEGAWRVSVVYPGSPAERSGIRSGWRLTSINGNPVTPNLLQMARTTGNCALRFSDEAGNAHLWKHRHFPFGVHLSQPLDPKFCRRIATGQYNIEDRTTLLELFSKGDIAAFAGLVGEFQSALGARQSIFVRMGLRRPMATDAIPLSDHHELLDMLALGFMARDEYKLARVACDAANTARERVGQASYSTNIHALNCFVQAHLYLAEGDTSAALEFGRVAWKLHPDYHSLNRLYWTLSGELPRDDSPVSPGTRFPIEYDLTNHDPVGEIPASGEKVSLSASLAAMAEGQLLVVVAYGKYRSNYYGNIDIERLAQIHAACPDIVADLHLIVSSDYALSAEHRHEAEGLARAVGLPMTVLWDEDDLVMKKVGRGGSPVRCVLDKSGIILSAAPFAQEQGFWEALEAQKHSRVLN